MPLQIAEKPDYEKVRKAIAELIDSEKAEDYDDGGWLSSSGLSRSTVCSSRPCKQHARGNADLSTALCTCRLFWTHPCASGMALFWKLRQRLVPLRQLFLSFIAYMSHCWLLCQPV